MFKWFKRIFGKKGESNVEAILSKLLNGEELSEEERAEASNYVGEKRLKKCQQKNDYKIKENPIKSKILRFQIFYEIKTL